MTTSFLPTSVERAILHLFEDLGTPYSLKANLLWRAGQWDDIANMSVDPKHYLDAESYWRDATAASIVRKLVELPTSFDRKAVAEENFLKSERECFRTNRRLLPYLSPGLPDTEKGVHEFLTRARKIVRRILGPAPDTCLTHENSREGTQRYVVQGRFGPGATFADRGMLTTIPDKMSSSPTITPDACFYHFPWSDTLWAQACRSSGRHPSYVQGNRFTTVSKDSTKDRGIAVEPSINLFFQLGYGRILRKRLSLAGINLAKGQDIHRRVAREASISGYLCTLDLSNASDTICSNLVKLLLPADWFAILNDLRSKKTLFKGRWHLLEKFSSMGNGFTFELETLIFLSLALALDEVAGHKLVPGVNVFVYGDDIILPTECSKAVIAALSFFGLTINKSKSFVDGPFRESCGGDYFLGVDVRPHFLKESPNEPQQLISLANGLRRVSSPQSKRMARVRRAWFSILDALPKSLRDLRGPMELGDLLIHDDETRWRPRYRSCIRYFKVYRPARFSRVGYGNFKPEVVLAAACYGTGSSQKGIIPRNGVTGYKVGWVPHS